MKPLKIAIVGFGPRGLSVLDRVAQLAPALDRPVHVVVVEPGPLGEGVHRTDLPSYLMLNTVASQATAVADSAMTAPKAPASSLPSFFSWCIERGELTCPVPPESPEPVTADAFLPRAMFGRYLADTARAVLTSGLDIDVRQAHATRVIDDDARVLVKLNGDEELSVDAAFVTVGHGPSRAWNQQLSARAPDGSSRPLDEVESGARVAVKGMGLLALDAVATFTVGRGGRFHRSGGRVVYTPSGTEPRLHLWSRSGHLPLARPSSPRSKPNEAPGLMTASDVATMRAERVGEQLDFATDVWPSLRTALLADPLPPEARRAVETMLDTEAQWESADDYQDAVLKLARYDLAEARIGLTASAFKMRLEGFRDAREALRSVVDSPGLTAAGHRAFFDAVPALSNRAAVGPQIERLEELLALVDARVVRFSVGPNPTSRRAGETWVVQPTRLNSGRDEEVDYLVDAVVDSPASALPELMPWAGRHPHDSRLLSLTRDGIVRRPDTSKSSVAVYGPPSEGNSYYNNYLLWPGTPSRLIRDVDAVLERWLTRAESSS